jgi:hypothetical protein
VGKKLCELITEDHLDFALAHVTSYYDTDFFPRADEFFAICHNWTEVKKHILESDFGGIFVAAPIKEPWPKIKGGYRVVHRLEPIDCLIYTAFAKAVSAKVEESRASPEVACAYRLTDSYDRFFGDGSGFEVFRERCEALSNTHEFVLCTDIADFYNKIYLHRLQNALELAASSQIASAIENFLTILNTKASQGIPVGPAASIVMSEVTLNDVDKFLYTKGVEYVRYVDDFRIFGGSKGYLEKILQDLVIYLHETQRLALNSSKTYILNSADYIEQELNNQYAQEKIKIFGDLDGVGIYSAHSSAEDDFGDDQEADVEDAEEVGDILFESLSKMLAYESLDLGLIRAIVRRAKAHKSDSIFELLVERLDFILPAINDVILYFDSLSDDKFLDEKTEVFASIVTSGIMNSRVARLWFEWYFSRHQILLKNSTIRNFIFGGESLRSQAIAAISTKNEAWIKERKERLQHYVLWDRRSIILAASVLSKDERDKWLRPLMKGNSLSHLDEWMIKWVLDGSPRSLDCLDIPF